ncbi:MAG: NUDIX hydrolase [Thermoguttaceae bacterium]|nr:NUDIX hydrolase [Thermoguttaceae bacterium]
MSQDENEIVFSCPIFKLEKTWQLGRSGRKHTRYVIRHPGGVGVLPILPNGELLLVKQFRVAVGRFIYEIPAGMKEPGEEPLLTARRELKEETGYDAEKWTPYPSFYASPGYLDEKLTLFLAEGLTPGESALEDGENLSLTSVPLEKALEMIDSGEIEDGKTVGAILRYALDTRLGKR